MSAPSTDAPPLPLFVLGASGVLSGELLRLAAAHPGLTLAGAGSREGGQDLRALHPELGEALPLATLDLAGLTGALRGALDEGPAALVLGLPHGASAAAWRALRSELGEAAERLTVVDLSADYRLSDASAHARWYGGAHEDADELPRFAYGLPELAAEPLAGRTRVAAPGCFATALQLACVPAARAGVLAGDRPWVLNAVTGSSGSGATPKEGTHHPFRHGNLWAYALDGHRHEAELAQALAPLALAPPLVFLPHSGPFARGIHLTATLPLARELDAPAARALYADAYGAAPFVEVLAGGAPDLRRVVGSNRAALSVHVRSGSLVVLLTLDNLIKGGAGQALQCLNLACGLAEDAGLPHIGLGVV